ncbi:MAG: hypothetical protein HYX41_05570 [Bdellovibrio sp.]|nr:hypothetical protein [Bdellovibrio sp.]
MSNSVSVVVETTPLPIIANVSRVVTKVVDRITGDRGDYPLLVAAACVEALKKFGIESRVMYGQVGWIEILEDMAPIWAGCWGQNFHFWVATQYGEVVDLNTSVAHRKISHANPQFKPLYSPPMLWSVEVPPIYRYLPEGVAELDLTEERDQKRFETVLQEISEKCIPAAIVNQSVDDLEFPNEPILCPGRRVLDDSKESFRHYDRALGIFGIPSPPDVLKAGEHTHA